MRSRFPFAKAYAALMTTGLIGCGGAIDAGPSQDAGREGGTGGGTPVDSGVSDTYDAGSFDASFGPYDGAPPPYDSGCDLPAIPLMRTPTYLLYAIDGSKHLDPTAFAGMVSAVEQEIGTIAQEAQPGLKVGLFVFGSADDTACADAGVCGGPYPAQADVPIASVDTTQDELLQARLQSLSQGSAWDPMYTALQGGAKDLLGTSGVNKALFVVTGGVPSDGTTQEAVDFIAQTRAQDSSFYTYVFGIGDYPTLDATRYDPAFLGQLAFAGATATPGCNPLVDDVDAAAGTPCYSQVNPGGASQNLSAALYAERAKLDCDFTIPLQPKPLDPTAVNVIVGGLGYGGNAFPQDPVDGWTFGTPGVPSRVLLHGAACTFYTNNPTKRVTIVLGCGGIIHD